MAVHQLLVGTSKGLVVYELTDRQVTAVQVFFTGIPVSMIFVDERNGTWWVSLAHRHWGEKLHYSTDQGKTWEVADIPSYRGYEYRPGKPASLRKIWVMQQGGTDRLNELWVGTEPGGLFYSDDYGKSFRLNEALWNHPSRLDDQQWFGTGKDYPFIHSIQVDPRDSNHIYIGISSAGVFETTDGGHHWIPRNRGLIAAYLPNETTDVGHDPHHLLLCRQQPDVLWQQNHCGIFKSIDGAQSWINVSGQSGWPVYGFAMAIDDSDPNRAWVVPAESDLSRIPAGLSLQVAYTRDGGTTWHSVSQGLPERHCFDLVLRQALERKNNLIAFGTNNGNLYCSFDDGGDWITLSNNLSPVFVLACSKKA
jgi:ligand-binding sensor domain-containing protein